MKSESDLSLYMSSTDRYLEFSFLSFLIYGWYGWIINPILGILISPLLFIKYSIQCSSFEKGKIYTKKKIYLMSRTGLGYTQRNKKNGLKNIFLFLVLIMIVSTLISVEDDTKLAKEDSVSVGTVTN